MGENNAEGVLWAQGSSPAMTRWLGNSGGNTQYPTNVTQAAMTSHFSSKPPWGFTGRVSMRPDGSVASRCPVNQTSLQVAANWGDTCYSDTNDDTNGQQKMLYVPQFCSYVDYVAAYNIVYWIGQVGDTITLQDSATGSFTSGGATTKTFTSADIHPAFISNSVVKPGIFVGAYQMYNNGGVGQSIAGVQPDTLSSITNARVHANSVGTGWGIEMYQARCAIITMFLSEFATWYGWNITTLGVGNTNLSAAGGVGNCACNTGYTRSIGNASGNVSFTSEGYNGQTPTATTQISYRGFENLWGGVFNMVDGINIDYNGKVYVADHGPFSTVTTSNTEGPAFSTPYVDSGLVWGITSAGYATALDYTQALKWPFIVSVAGGSSSTYIPCYCAAGRSHAGYPGLVIGSDYGPMGAGRGLLTCRDTSATGVTVSTTPVRDCAGTRIQYIIP